MLKVDGNKPSPDWTAASLADLSRNASVISTSSSDSGPSVHLSAPRPRPIRTFTSPQSGGPNSPGLRTPTGPPPNYLSYEFGLPSTAPDDADEPLQPPPPLTERRARSESRSRASKVSISDFKFGKTVGEGSFSTVKQVTYIPTGKLYAMKVLEKSHLIRHKKESTASAEKNALARLGKDHPGVIHLHWTFQDKRRLYFVLDLAPNGEMQTRISRMGSLSLACAKYYSAQIVDAIDYMHSRGVIHRDLKPENLLLDADFRIKIADFGTGKVLEPGAEQSAKTFVGTAQYISPELLESNKTSKSSDFWALGCIVYQMIAGRFTFQGLSEYLTLQKIKRLEYSFPPGFDEQARDLVERLLVKDPDLRFGAGAPGSENDIAALRAHPFFSSIDWETLWTDPPPPLESGLVKREDTDDRTWDDVTASWGGSNDSDDDSDGIPWDSEALQRDASRERIGASEREAPNIFYDNTTPPNFNNYAFGEPEKKVAFDTHTPNIIPRTPEEESNGKNEFPWVVPPSPSTPTVSPINATPSKPIPIAQPKTEREIIPNSVPSSEGSPAERFGAVLDAMRQSFRSASSRRSSPEKVGGSSPVKRGLSPENRGRNPDPTPIQGNLPLISDLSSLLLRDEAVIFTSAVASHPVRRRASRLLPLHTPVKIKPRQLVLTNQRILCLKQRKSTGDTAVKLELCLKTPEKDPQKAKDARAVVVSIEPKGEREFVILTSTKSHHFAAIDPNLCTTWMDKINSTLDATRS